MPIPIATAITICYVAWNFGGNSPQTGDSVNHTLRLIRDGVESTPTNSPVEVDATNAPGIYRLALTATEMNASLVALVGKSSTSAVSIIPVTLATQ